MRLRFKSLLTLIFFLIIIIGAIGIGYVYYSDVNGEADLEIDGDLTINYLNGKKFKTTGDGKIEFSVTNNGEDQEYYYIQFVDVRAKDVKYELTSSDDLKINNSLKSDFVSNQIMINGKKTVNYTINFKSDSDAKYSGAIQVGVKTNENNTFSEVILSNNNIGDMPLSSFGENATLDEGMLALQDDTGIAYYFRGATKNNYVSFADLTWRIVKVNGDGSVKLVLDGITDRISKYYDSDKEFLNSTIITELNAWYDEHLSEYSSYTVYHNYCNDLTLENDNKTYIAYNRLFTNKIPTFVCLGKTSNAKIGLLTADEVMLAGGSNKANSDYYLYNKNINTAYYTMTSGLLSGSNYNPFIIDTDGSIQNKVSGTLLRGVRPVINIIKTAKVEGLGTAEEPYKLIIN